MKMRIGTAAVILSAFSSAKKYDEKRSHSTVRAVERREEKFRNSGKPIGKS
jgi:hypothetical protein